jgi:uncharacterized protein (DUF885 family)
MPHRFFCAVVAALLLAAALPARAAAADEPAVADRALAALVEGYFEEYLQLHPVTATFIGDHRYDDRYPAATPAQRAAALELERRSLAALESIDRARLGAGDQLTWELFAYGRRHAIAAAAYPSQFLPLDQFDNGAVFFAQLGSGTTAQPFVTVRDYDNFLARMAAFPAWTDQAIAWLREGVRRGVVQPRVIMERVLPQLSAMVVASAEQSVFWQPVAAMPESFASADRERLTAAYRSAIAGQVVPAYRRLHDYVRDEYLPRTRTSVGLSALPGGAAWYAYLARGYTTTDTPVAEIHQIGLREVARIRGEIAATGQRVGLTGNAGALAESMRQDPRFRYATAQDLLDAFEGLRARVDREIPRLFALTPQTALDIRPIEAYRAEASAAAEYYPPAANGTRPGIFYVNTHDLPARPSYDVEALYLHEAIPGHHFQIALTVENPRLPRFRRYGAAASLLGAPDPTTAYIEGWGLYAESLGQELGLYTDPYQRLGSLFMEAWRAARLVIDTGLHAQGWTREQAIEYMLANTAASRTDAVAEVERYIALPGQALAYKTGQMEIRRLRNEAERALGPRFDPRAFHAQVLDSGPLPLSLLRAKIDRWIASTRYTGSTP